MEMLENSIKKYHNKILTAAEVIEELIKLSKDIQKMDKEPQEMGMSDFEYAFYTSVDGENWGEPLSSGEFSNIENNPIAQIIKLDKAIKSQYIKLVSLSTVKNSSVTSIAEIDVFTEN